MCKDNNTNEQEKYNPHFDGKEGSSSPLIPIRTDDETRHRFRMTMPSHLSKMYVYIHSRKFLNFFGYQKFYKGRICGVRKLLFFRLDSLHLVYKKCFHGKIIVANNCHEPWITLTQTVWEVAGYLQILLWKKSPKDRSMSDAVSLNLWLFTPDFSTVNWMLTKWDQLPSKIVYKAVRQKEESFSSFFTVVQHSYPIHSYTMFLKIVSTE